MTSCAGAMSTAYYLWYDVCCRSEHRPELLPCTPMASSLRDEQAQLGL